MITNEFSNLLLDLADDDLVDEVLMLIAEFWMIFINSSFLENPK